ncbi:class I adenylate-forming enzyme family protein [Chitinasiproducens palmae]|uniref:Acyl-CoA synthetase (AMP-forming)/AMP-acid ligase II n=1 Tax=Chitinasiproducens palmae TaxID=1770053 RepID=A0A1H2PQI1_9BURK|nr:class I adenylate-forming enzyme family protein [Chitinasiproducens palmae]SDV49011.1 Acyl-CoA synthetase (AMP-forming)/AMP-acid ligase II [Chitinasiproducens palmae]
MTSGGPGTAASAASSRISDIPRRWASATPDGVAVREEGEAVTFGQLWHNIEAAIAFLQGRGVGLGDRVMIVTENCTASITLLFALSEIGAWPAVVNARLSEREIESIRAHCRPRLMIFTHSVSPDAVRHGVNYRAREITPPGLGPLMEAALDAESPREPEALARQVALLIYTSGTTGQPKGVMATHRGLMHFARVSARSRDLSPRDCSYAVMPISHIFGLATVLLGTFEAGASLMLFARFKPEDVLHGLADGTVTILQGVPTMFARILAYLRDHPQPVRAPALRYVYTGGGPVEATLKREVEATFGQPLHHGYGMTEYAGSVFITRMERPRNDVSCGEIVEGAELRVVGADGRDVPTGEPGELWVRGPGVMHGYYRSPEQTAEALREGGWLNTGDIGRLGSDGALFVVGRSNDLIIRSGFNVYPIEVESVVNSHPAVKQSAVIGRRTADNNEEIVAFVEVRPGHLLDVAELQEFLKPRLSAFKRPSHVLLLDRMPFSASGKLLKQRLRALADEALVS